MAVDIETATLEDYRDMMLRPTKLNETAQVLYDLAQKAGGSLIEIGTNKSEIAELKEIVSVLADALISIGTDINNLEERVSALENA